MNSLLLLGLAAAAPSYELLDAGRKGALHEPRALIVVTPGYAVPAYEVLVTQLEQAGVDAWLVRIPLASQDSDAMAQVALPAAARQLRQATGTPLALVGHGLGGLAAAEASLAAEPDALALLGAPLLPSPVALTRWLAEQPILATRLSPTTPLSWRGEPALPLLLGDPLPPLEAVSGHWLAQQQDRLLTGRVTSLDDLGVPVWAGASGGDNLAPPEAVRPALGVGATFVRFGFLRMDPVEYTSSDLLHDEVPARALASWVAATLGGA